MAKNIFESTQKMWTTKAQPKTLNMKKCSFEVNVVARVTYIEWLGECEDENTQK